MLIISKFRKDKNLMASRTLYSCTMSLVQGETSLELKSGNMDSTIAGLSTIKADSAFALVITHENKVGFPKQVSYLRACSEKLGIEISDSDGVYTFICPNIAIATGIAYLANLCRVAPGNWPNYSESSDCAKKVLKDINVSGFKKFVQTGIDSPKLPMTSRSEKVLEESANSLGKARQAFLVALK